MFKKKLLEMEGYQGRKEKKTGQEGQKDQNGPRRKKWYIVRRWKSTGGRRKDKGRSNEIGAWSLDDPNETRRRIVISNFRDSSRKLSWLRSPKKIQLGHIISGYGRTGPKEKKISLYPKLTTTTWRGYVLVSRHEAKKKIINSIFFQAAFMLQKDRYFYSRHPTCNFS